MKRIITLLLLMQVNAVFGQNQGLKTLDFFIGAWDLTTTAIQPDGTFVNGKARSEVKYILDGLAIEDDFLLLNEQNEVVFKGISLRSYNQQTGKFQIVWVMPGITGITDISAEWKDRKLISTGKGYDGGGAFLERFEYYDITDTSYKFKMDRSYDDGKTWIENFSRISATRIQ